MKKRSRRVVDRQGATTTAATAAATAAAAAVSIQADDDDDHDDTYSDLGLGRREITKERSDNEIEIDTCSHEEYRRRKRQRQRRRKHQQRQLVVLRGTTEQQSMVLSLVFVVVVVFVVAAAVGLTTTLSVVAFVVPSSSSLSSSSSSRSVCPDGQYHKIKNKITILRTPSFSSSSSSWSSSSRTRYFFSSSSSGSSVTDGAGNSDNNSDDDENGRDDDNDHEMATVAGDDDPDDSNTSRQRKIRRRVRQLAKSVVSRPLALATTVPVPSAIAAVLKEASMAAAEQVEDAITQQQHRQDQNRSRNNSNSSSNSNGGAKKGSKSTTNKDLKLRSSSTGKRSSSGSDVNDDDDDSDSDSTLSTTEMIESIIDEAFAPMELSLQEMEESLVKARAALNNAKQQSYEAMEALQVAAEAQAQGAAEAVAQVEKAAQRQVMVDIYESSGAAGSIAASSSSSSAGTADVIDDISKLTFDDVDYDSSEMAPPFLDPDSCLVPGEPVIRVEKAPENSRRIFAGIDIMASVDDVWNVLTKYDELQNVIPNLVVNDVLELYDGETATGRDVVNDLDDENVPEEVKCKDLAQRMKGSLLKQVGGAKVAGINFSARTTLEVREWPNGMPDFAHFSDDMYEGKSREVRAREYPKVKLKRYRFPRPFALSRLPTRDISMQSIVDDDGEFRLYQGVWRMQPLPGCAPPGKEAMRLTYAVEISPRAYLPVKLVEGRIVKDLATNLIAIRNAVTA